MRRSILCITILLFMLPVVLAHEAEEKHVEPTTLGEYLITNLRPGYEATTTAWWVAGIGAFLVLALAAWRWSRFRPKQRKPVFWAKTAGGIAIVLITVFILYSAYAYWYSGVAKEGLEICDASGCRISVHWHATLEEMMMCGQTVERPWETGELSAAHTHKDNRIHVHEILRIDPQTKDIIDKEPLTLSGFFDAIRWKFSENCFKDTCGMCDGRPASTKVWINGQLVGGNPRDVMWRDGDVISIAFE